MTRYLMTLAASAFLAAGSAFAQTPAPAAAPGDSHSGHHPAPTAEQELSEGEVTRVDAKALKVTLRHGDLKNLNMPPMTMIFRVQDAALLDALKPGDKVRFRAEQIKGAYYVTQIEKAR